MQKARLELELRRLSAELVKQMTAAHKSIACAESCTGGLIAKSITDIAGSSACFDRGVIAYGNEAKRQMLGVDEKSINEHGAVSEPVVRQMAAGMLSSSCADIVLAVSGITGPGGGTLEKPVGTVWFCWLSSDGKIRSLRRQFSGDRELIRLQSAVFGLQMVLDNFI